MTPADVQAFWTALCPCNSNAKNIAGAVVLVVKDGKIFFAKGYGYSDVEKKASRQRRRDSFPSWLYFQTVHLDCGDATGRARQADLDHDINGTWISRFLPGIPSQLLCATS